MIFKKIFSVCIVASLALVMFTSCNEKIQNQPLSYTPDAKSVCTTETGCEIYETKEFKAKTAYEDYAICISQIDNLDTTFNVNIPQVVTKDQNQLTKVNDMLYDNGTLGDSLNNPDIQEFESHYGITFAEYNVVSICQQVTCTTAMHNMEFARACTFDRDTDTILSIDKYFDLEELLDLYNTGDLKIYMDQGYDDDTIKELLMDYANFCSNDTNFFINLNSIFMIVPVSGSNSTYIIVEAVRN